MKSKKPRIGSKFEVWASTGIVVAVWPYTGQFPQFFTYFVRVFLPESRRITELAV